jgi:hypothetical protein
VVLGVGGWGVGWGGVGGGWEVGVGGGGGIAFCAQAGDRCFPSLIGELRAQLCLVFWVWNLHGEHRQGERQLGRTFSFPPVRTCADRLDLVTGAGPGRNGQKRLRPRLAHLSNHMIFNVSCNFWILEYFSILLDRAKP